MKASAPRALTIAQLIEITGASKDMLHRRKRDEKWTIAGTAMPEDGIGRPVSLFQVDSFSSNLQEQIKAHFERKAAQEKLRYKEDQGELTKLQVLRGRAKHEVLLLAAAYELKHGKGRKSLEAFCKAYSAKEIAIEPKLQDVKPKVTIGQIYRWRRVQERAGLDGLCGRHKKKQVSIIDRQSDLIEWMMTYFYNFPHIVEEGKFLALKRDIETENTSNKRGWDIPSESSLRRWFNKQTPEMDESVAYATNPSLYSNSFRPIHTKHRPGRWPNDVWELDGTPADVMCTDGRFKITAGMDSYCRRVAMLVVPQQSTDSNLELIRKMVARFGMPCEDSTIKTDNGSDYVSHRFMAALHRCGLNQIRTRPYSGKEKPYIERFFRTLSHDLFERMPGYIGHNVSGRKRIEDKLSFEKKLAARKNKEENEKIFQVNLSGAELQEVVDDWVENVYEHRGHSGLDGRTPNDVYLSSRYKPQMPDQKALALLTNAIGYATVRRGQVRCKNVVYVAPEFMDMPGRQVELFVNPLNPEEAYAIDIANGYENGQLFRINNIEDTDRLGLTKKMSAKLAEREKKLLKIRRQYQAKAKEFGLDTLFEREIEVAKAARVGIANFSQRSGKLDTPLFNAFEKALQNGASNTIEPTKQASDMRDVMDRLDREKAQLTQAEAPIQEARRKVIRSEQDIIQQLIVKEQEEGLTEDEATRVADYQLDDVGRMQVKVWRQDAIYERAKRAENE